MHNSLQKTTFRAIIPLWESIDGCTFYIGSELEDEIYMEDIYSTVLSGAWCPWMDLYWLLAGIKKTDKKSDRCADGRKLICYDTVWCSCSGIFIFIPGRCSMVCRLYLKRLLFSKISKQGDCCVGSSLFFQFIKLTFFYSGESSYDLEGSILL